VLDTAQTAHLLTAAGPAGSAVDEVRQRRAVPGRLRSVVAVEDEDATVPGGDPADEFGGELGIVGDHRTDQGTAPAGGQGHGLLGVGIRDDRGHGSEGFDVMDGIGPWVIGLQHGGRDIGAAVLGGQPVGLLATAGQQVGSAGEDGVDGIEHVGPLPSGDDRAQPRGLLPRIPDPVGGQFRDDRLTDRLGMGLGNEGAADRGALLSGLDGHLLDDAGNEEVELLRSGPASGPSREKLSESASAKNRVPRSVTQSRSARRRAVAAEPVKAMASCSASWSNSGVTSPLMSWMAPSGADRIRPCRRRPPGSGARCRWRA
jgi:hypothetical protein